VPHQVLLHAFAALLSWSWSSHHSHRQSPAMALVLIQDYRHWLSDTLLRYGLITEPLPGLRNEHVERDRSGDEIPVIDEDPDQEYLSQLDPRNWKEQDHYAVLGLKKKRFAASEEEIRRNYRRMILHHHPDKRGHVVDPEQDYFACITKAFEILGDATKRRSYDSVDPTFDDDVPSQGASSRKNFFSVFDPVFRLNARWSVNQPVPELGDINSTRQEVDAFYTFWYNFESWREYSYQDEEDKERGQDRDERRWIEKENRAIRQKKKKEEMARIRTLVDNAYHCDPRIPKFREQEKQSREEEKRKKQEARKQQKEEEQRLLQQQEEQARIVREKDEAEQRIRREAEKKEREAAKRARKRIRKQIESVLQQCDYFTSTGSDYSKFQALLDVDRIFQTSSLEQLEELSQFFEQNTDNNVRREKFFSMVGKVDSNHVKPDVPAKQSVDQNSNVQSAVSSKKWSAEDSFLLIKAAKIFPPGTADRWEVITAYFNQHSASGTTRKLKEVMAKSKELQDPSEYYLLLHQTMFSNSILINPNCRVGTERRFHDKWIASRVCG
jgi:DnaJ family protein C protein 2